MKEKMLISILLITSFILSACNLPGASAPASSAASTAAALTVQAVLSPPVTETPTISATVTPSACEDLANFTVWTRDGVTFDVKEVEKRLAPGKVFTMVWTLRNDGTCTWDETYKMYFDSGTPLTEATSFPVIPIGSTVPPGGTVNVSIPMTAPQEVGEYETVFSLKDKNGKSAINLGVTTKVGNASEVKLASPGELRYTYDCTTGFVNVGLTWIDRADNEDGYRIYRDGNLLADLGAGSTSYSDQLPYSGQFNYSVAAYNTSGESPAGMKVETKNCQ